MNGELRVTNNEAAAQIIVDQFTIVRQRQLIDELVEFITLVKETANDSTLQYHEKYFFRTSLELIAKASSIK